MSDQVHGRYSSFKRFDFCFVQLEDSSLTASPIPQFDSIKDQLNSVYTFSHLMAKTYFMT
jgi:hypothetical protein